MKIRKMLVAGAALACVTAGPAVAQTSYVGGNTQVRGGNETRPAPETAGAGESRGLPVTGGDVAGLTLIGLAAVGTGTVLVRRSSRRRPAAA